MDWKTLFLDANGRIGPKDFWIAVAIMIVVNIVMRYIPILGAIVMLAMTYPWICVTSKRLHDFGKSGWLAAVPIAIMLVAILIASVTGGVAVLAASGGSGAGALAGLGMTMAVIGLGGLACLGFLIWVGVMKGDLAPNRYGPPPVSLIGGSTTTPAA